jgi:cytochrome P450
MTAVTELDLPAFDYSDPELTGDPWHAAIRAARERGWLARAEPIGFFVLEREAAAFFLRTPKATFPGTQILELQGVTEGPLWERLRGNLLDLDGDDHRRLRKLVQPAFTPPAADRHRPAMRRHLAELFEPVAGGQPFEATAALTKPYPARMIAELMGAPVSDADRLGVWANLIQGQFDPIKIANEREALERAAAEFVEYTRELLAARHDDLGDDLISELIAAEEEGDRLSADEVVHLTSAILVGGVDTTQAQLAHALITFARHPEQWELLAEQPELAPRAVEELLRYEPITPITARVTLEDIDYDGVTFPEGTLIFAAAVAANRDPAAYEEPDRFDITAERGRAKPLTFGAGPHFCLGANLARAELQEALTFLPPRMPGLRLEADPVYDTPLGVYAVEELLVSFDGDRGRTA